MPQAPWEKYQTAAPTQEAGPWTKYAAPPGELSPTLLASRQEASKGEFEANRPESTIGSRTREAAIGVLEPFDLRNVPGMLSSIGGAMWEAAQGKYAGKAADLVKGVITAPLRPVGDFASGLAEGDYDKAAGGAGGILSQTVPAVEGLRRVTPERVAELPAKTTKAVVAKGTEIVSGVPANPVVAMTQALKPYAKNLDWDRAITSSLPEIKRSEAALGRPIANVDDMLEATKIAKKRLRAEFDTIKGPKSGQMVDGSPIADAIEGTISKKVQLENPVHAKSIKDLADKYRKSFSVEDLDEFLHTYNAELESYYSKYPAAKRTATAGNPETAALEAGGRATRDVLYKALDDPRLGASAREINQKYGKLINIEKELYRRRNVNARQAPESLTEQMGKLGAAFQTGKGALKVLTGDIGGVADIGSAVAGRKMAQILKERNSTDYLIRKTFETLKLAP